MPVDEVAGDAGVMPLLVTKGLVGSRLKGGTRTGKEDILKGLQD